MMIRDGWTDRRLLASRRSERRRHQRRVGASCRPAFTLIELLVVVSIIVLLIAMLLPSLTNAREMARRAVCRSNLAQMGSGCQDYASDNGGYLPLSQQDDGTDWVYAFDVTVPSTGGSGAKRNGGIGLILPEGTLAGNAGMFYCPSLDSSDSSYGTTWHSMDVDRSNWWNGVGVSFLNRPGFVGRRGIISYNYRAPSFFRVYGKQLRRQNLAPRQVMVIDTPDPRFGMKYAHREGYNYARGDGGVAWFPDPDARIEAFALGNGTVVDGVGRPTSDEFAYDLIEAVD